jgi:DNA-binding HxlR family transcriptional regulator
VRSSSAACWTEFGPHPERGIVESLRKWHRLYGDAFTVECSTGRDRRLTLDGAAGGRARFSELELAVPGISQRLRSSTLRNLERDGLVIREVFPEVPPRVEYEITDLGKSLLRPTQGLVDWAKANWEQVREAQAKYDAR